MADVPDYYEILQVHPKASPLMIKKAYRTLLLAGGHPDLGGNKAETQLLTEAYEILSDPDRRMAYDRRFSVGRGGTTTIIVSVCPHCGVYNRVRSETKLLVARCGKCGQPIGKVKAPTSKLKQPPKWLSRWPWFAGGLVVVVLGVGIYLAVSLWNEGRDPLQEAADLEERGQLSLAAERLKALVTSDPRNLPAHQRLGRVLEAEHRFEPAIVEYQKASMLAPDSPKAHYLVGQALLRMGRLGEAEQSLRRAVELDPADVGALMMLGNLLARTDRTDEAISIYRKAIPLDAHNGDLYYRLGAVYQQRGEADQAINLYRQALTFDPREREALLNLGKLYQDRSAYTDALTQYQRAALVQNEDPDLHFRMAELYRQTKDLANAEREYRLSQAQARGNPTLLERVQRALLTMGDRPAR